MDVGREFLPLFMLLIGFVAGRLSTTPKRPDHNN
jgi:hypothetical protein